MNPLLFPTMTSIAGLALTLLSERKGNASMGAIGKTAASCGFLWFAWSVGIECNDLTSQMAWLALVLCAIGDICLLSNKKTYFLAGLGSFLVAHICFAACFLSIDAFPMGLVLSILPLGVLDVLVWRWLSPFLGSMRGPVIAYIVAINLMVCTAAGTWTSLSGQNLLILFAVVFLVSDLFVARERFVIQSFTNRFIGLPLYYCAQFGLIYCIAASATLAP